MFFTGAQLLHHFQAAHFRHHIVEQDQVRSEAVGFLQRVDPVNGALEDVVVLHQLLLQQIEIKRLIIDD